MVIKRSLQIVPNPLSPRVSEKF